MAWQPAQNCALYSRRSSSESPFRFNRSVPNMALSSRHEVRRSTPSALPAGRKTGRESDPPGPILLLTWRGYGTRVDLKIVPQSDVPPHVVTPTSVLVDGSKVTPIGLSPSL